MLIKCPLLLLLLCCYDSRSVPHVFSMNHKSNNNIPTFREHHAGPRQPEKLSHLGSFYFFIVRCTMLGNELHRKDSVEWLSKDQKQQ